MSDAADESVVSPANIAKATSLLVAIGGAVGAISRVGVEALLPTTSMADPRFPWATFAVNILGAALLGGVLAFCELRRGGPGWIRPLVGIGFCGSFTTFSTMSVEFVHLVETRHAWLAIGYFAASFVVGIAAAFVGTRVVVSVFARSSGATA